MDPWLAVVVVGFVLMMGLVIALARTSTARWERQRATTRRRSIRREVRAHGRAFRGELPEPSSRRRARSPVPVRSWRPRGRPRRRSATPRVPGGP